MSNKITPLLEGKALEKIYNENAAQSVKVFSNLDLSIYPKDCVAIVGRSGEGKSTLLHLLGGLDKPSKGNLFVEGQSYYDLTEKEQCRLRNRFFGFVYQFHHLLPEFTSLENVMMPLLIGKIDAKTAKEKSEAMLAKVGLSHRLHHKISALSGGERQRVAIARALVHSPACLLADEPTGNLDAQTSEEIFSLLMKLNTELGVSIIMITHDIALASRMKTVLHLDGGKLKPHI
jgi:lipoprotein-releasing system ATP-binding protein